ncbi:hypothetical protein MHM84_17560 [Halomonas sp. McH1-25]|uniref:tautomerase family protein n=1 Tax=unclassified Halomonas TaxID=2609666 RepID=UPI001EF5DCF8|nr:MULTISPECIES: hypothetical protein [unclassified Halomonas]MCG7601577.1 hypothetical protein [Halomonas sp. McH1-25]MCP1343152.1 hypothetical protein [Halomonas sp. FL8]MCP1360963.1 hypothetical protein [Halomonas sp. BBD45]MCP1364078.1 hypothetical protein [Halomonas sp. BBD48]
MPIINVIFKLGDGSKLNNDSFGLLAQRLTESTVRVLKKKRELTVVRINHDTSNAQWFSGGKPLLGNAFEITIKITNKSNTQEEVSTWSREAYESVIHELGGFEGPNYISVLQNDETNWGFNGLTQYARKQWAS